MNREQNRLAVDAELRDLHLLLRMSGRTQKETARILNIPRQQVSTEEQEPRYKDRQALVTSWVANALLSRSICEKHFAEPKQYESDLERIRRKIYP